MAGIAMMAAGISAAAGSGDPVGSVTLGNDVSVVGYDNDGVGASFGSLSGITEIDALTIIKLVSTNSSDFQLELTALSDPTQSHFTSITIEDGAGTPTELTTASASNYFYTGGATDVATWIWGDGTSRLWETGDVAEVKEFTVVV